MTTLEEANVVDDLKVAKDLFSGAVGGIAQVLIGECFHLLVYYLWLRVESFIWAVMRLSRACHKDVARYLNIVLTAYIYCRYAVIADF